MVDRLVCVQVKEAETTLEFTFDRQNIALFSELENMGQEQIVFGLEHQLLLMGLVSQDDGVASLIF